MVFILVFNKVQSAIYYLPGITGHYYIINIAPFSSTVWILVYIFVFPHSFSARFLGVFRFPYLPGEDNTSGASRVNDSYPCRRPGEDKVSAYALIQHAVVSASI
ncbi:hypothetical protein ES703_88222 [subsurface metagenome]